MKLTLPKSEAKLNASSPNPKEVGEEHKARWIKAIVVKSATINWRRYIAKWPSCA